DERTYAAVSALQLLHHQSILDIRHSGAAVAFQAGAEESEFRHGLYQLAGKTSCAVAFLDNGHEIVFDELPRVIAHQALLFREQRIEFDEVNVLELKRRHSGSR